MGIYEAFEFLDKRSIHCVKPGLERIETLCAYLGNPQKDFKSIHIAGTNGKTSVTRMISSVLSASGMKVGRYTSPHMQCVGERIALKERILSDGEFGQYLLDIIPAIEEVEGETQDPLTYFEITTALAFYVFSRTKMDAAVLETGMGGRLDATNIVSSEVSVITNIGMDHVAELGPNLENIASEKLGIIKKEGTLITAESKREILIMMEEKCQELGADMLVFGRDFSLNYAVTVNPSMGQGGQVITLSGLFRLYDDLTLPLLGHYQANNAAVAVAACERFVKDHRMLGAAAVESGLKSVKSPGRLEIVARDPMIVLDGAHNPDGATNLMSVITNDIDYREMILVIAILSDKDFVSMLRIMAPHASKVILTKLDNERSAPAYDLKRTVEAIGTECDIVEDARGALDKAVSIATADDLICITGSIYLIGEIKTAMGIMPA